MFRKHLMLLAVMVVCSVSILQAKKKNDLETKTMYFYGMAKSYSDSLVYMTEIMMLENVAIDKETGGVLNIEMYSEQLKNYLAQMGKKGYICSLFYEKKAKKIEKSYMKLKKRIQNNGGAKFAPLAFRYEYVDPGSVYRNSIEEKKEGEEPQSE